MRLNTLVLLAGHLLMVGTFATLTYYLPVDGSKPKFAGTKLEAYIAGAFFTAFALAAAMITFGFLEYF